MAITDEVLTGDIDKELVEKEREKAAPPPEIDPDRVRTYSSHLLAEKNIVDKHLNPLVSYYANTVSGARSAVQEYGMSPGPIREPASDMLNYIEGSLDEIEDPAQAERWVGTTFGDQASNAMMLLNLQAGARSGRIYKDNQDLFQNYSKHLREDNRDVTDVLRQYEGEKKGTPLYGLLPGGELMEVTPTLNRDFNRRLGKVIDPGEAILLRLNMTPELLALYEHMGPDVIPPDKLRLIVDREGISKDVKNGIFDMYKSLTPEPGESNRGQVIIPLYRDEEGQTALHGEVWLMKLKAAATARIIKRETGIEDLRLISNEEFVKLRDEHAAEAEQIARRVYARELDNSGIPTYGQMTHEVVEDQIKRAAESDANVRKAYESLGPMFEAKKELASSFSKWKGTLGFAFKTGSKRLPSAAFQLGDTEMEGHPDFRELVGHLEKPFQALDDNYQMLEDRDQGWWHYARALNPMESFGTALYLAEKKRTDKGLPLNTVDTFLDAWKEGGSEDHYRTMASMEEHGDLWLVDQLGQYFPLLPEPGFYYGAHPLRKKEEQEGLIGWYDESLGLAMGIWALIRNPDAIYLTLTGTGRAGGAGMRALKGGEGTAQAKAKAVSLQVAAQDVRELKRAGRLNPNRPLSEINATLEAADRGDRTIRGLVDLAYNATIVSARRGLQNVATTLRADRNIHRVQQTLQKAATEADDVRFAAVTELTIKTAENELKTLQKVRAGLLLELKRLGPLWERARNTAKTRVGEGTGRLKTAVDTAVDLFSDAGRRRATEAGLEAAAVRLGLDPHAWDTGSRGTGHYLNELRIRIGGLDNHLTRTGLKGEEAEKYIREWFKREFSPERWSPTGFGKGGKEGARMWPAMDVILDQRYRDLVKGLARNDRAVEAAEKLIGLRLLRQTAGVVGDPAKLRAIVLGMKDPGRPLTKLELEKTAKEANETVSKNFSLMNALEEVDTVFKETFLEFLDTAAHALLRATRKGGDISDVVAPAYLGVFDTIGRLSQEFDLKTLESILAKMQEEAPKQYETLTRMMLGTNRLAENGPEYIARQLLMIKGMDDLWETASKSEKSSKTFVSILTGARELVQTGKGVDGWERAGAPLASPLKGSLTGTPLAGLETALAAASLWTGYALRSVRNSWRQGARKEILDTLTRANPDYFDSVVSEAVQQVGRRIQQTALGFSSDLANLETRAALQARRLGAPEVGSRLDAPDSQFYKFFEFLTSMEPIFAPSALRVPKAAGEALAEAASPAARISSHQSPDGPVVSVALEHLRSFVHAPDELVESPTFLNLVASLVRTEGDLLTETKSMLNEAIRRGFSAALRVDERLYRDLDPRRELDSLIDVMHEVAVTLAPRVGVEPDSLRLIDPRVMDSAESLTELGDFTRAVGAVRLEAKAVSAMQNATGPGLTIRGVDSYNAWTRGGDYIKTLYKDRDFVVGDLVYLAEDTLRVSENLGGLTLADLAGHTARVPGEGVVLPAVQAFVSDSWRLVKVEEVAEAAKEYTLVNTKTNVTKVVKENDLSFGIPELWFEDILAPIINWSIDALPVGTATRLRTQASKVEADSRILQAWRTENGVATVPAFVMDRLLSSGDGLMLDLLRAARREGVGGDKLATNAFARQIESLLTLRRSLWVWGVGVPKAAHVGMVAAGNLAGSVVIAAGGPEGRAIGTSLRAGGEFILQGVVEAVPLLKQATIKLRNNKYEKVRDELGAAAAEGRVPPTVDHGILANPFLEKVLAGTSDIIPTPHGDKTGLELLEMTREAGVHDHIFKMDQIELARFIDTALDSTRVKEAFVEAYSQLIPNARNVMFEAATDMFAEYMLRTRLATFLELYVNQGASLAKTEEYLRLANYTTQNSMTTSGDRLLKSAFTYWGWFKQASAQAWHIQFADAGLGTAEQVARWARGGTAYQKLRVLKQGIYKLSQPGDGETLTAEEREDIVRRKDIPQWARDRNLNVTGTGEMVPMSDFAVNDWYDQFKIRPDYFLSSSPLDPIDGVEIWLDFTLIPSFSMARALIPEKDLPASMEQRDKFDGLIGSLLNIAKDQLIPELQVLIPSDEQQYRENGSVHLTYAQYRILQLFGRAKATGVNREGELEYTPHGAADRILLNGGRSLNAYLLKNLADMTSLILAVGGYSDADINRLAALDPETARFIDTARQNGPTWKAFMKQLVAVLGQERKYFTDFDKNQQATQKKLESNLTEAIKGLNGEAQQLSDGVTPSRELSKQKNSSDEEEGQ